MASTRNWTVAPVPLVMVALPAVVRFENCNSLPTPLSVMFAVPAVALLQKHMKPPLLTVTVELPAVLLSSKVRLAPLPLTVIRELPAVLLSLKLIWPPALALRKIDDDPALAELLKLTICAPTLNVWEFD